MSDELMIVFDGREDPRHVEGSHVVTHRVEIGKLYTMLVNLQHHILDNEPVRAWLKSEALKDHIRFLDRDERRAVPLVKIEEPE